MRRIAAAIFFWEVLMAGSVTLNGIDDEILAIAFKFKAEHEALFQFNPQQMQPVQIPAKPGKPPKQGYNNMTFSWNSNDGLKKVIELLQKIDHHEHKPAA
jgi:hypothetical protein